VVFKIINVAYFQEFVMPAGGGYVASFNPDWDLDKMISGEESEGSDAVFLEGEAERLLDFADEPESSDDE
jgi:hypothetical protein